MNRAPQLHSAPPPGAAARLLLAALRAYRAVISPWLGAHCRFAPSCSEYAIDAVTEYGAWRGCRIAAARLARCHPLHPGGWDPVRKDP